MLDIGTWMLIFQIRFRFCITFLFHVTVWFLGIILVQLRLLIINKYIELSSLNLIYIISQ